MTKRPFEEWWVVQHFAGVERLVAQDGQRFAKAVGPRPPVADADDVQLRFSRCHRPQRREK